MGDFYKVVNKIEFVGIGVISYFGIIVVWVVLNLFKVVVEVGEVMWGEDKWLEVIYYFIFIRDN